MEIDFHPAVTLVPGTFSILTAPGDIFAQALNCHLSLQRFQILYVCGNYSAVLSKLDRRFTCLDIRRAFTAYQLLTVLEEARHTLVIVEHDPLLYEDAGDMMETITRSMRDAARGACLLLYSQNFDPFLEEAV